MTIKPRKDIEPIIPYEPGKPIADVAKEYGLTNIIKMASNENPLGSSPHVINGLKDYLDGGINLYPDGNGTDLKEALAQFCDVDTDRIVLSNGADEMLTMVAQAYLNPGDEVVMSEWAFTRYGDASQIMGADIIRTPMIDFAYDLDSLISSITDKTKVLWICNPNNPTGSMIDKDTLYGFLDRIPKQVLIVYDEAYHEFASAENFPRDNQHLIDSYPNVIVVRTFSKIYGLAGLRVGYCITSPGIARNINKVRGPFNVSSMAQYAAIEALKDQAFVKEVYDLNLEGKEYIYEAFKAMGIVYYPSEANHILFETDWNARDLFVAMQKIGVIIRPQKDNYMRVSIGTMEENRRFIEALKEVLAI